MPRDMLAHLRFQHSYIEGLGQYAFLFFIFVFIFFSIRTYDEVC